LSSQKVTRQYEQHYTFLQKQMQLKSLV